MDVRYGAASFETQTYSHVSVEDQLVNNRYKLEMWLKDRVCTGIFPLGEARNSIVKRV
jgi:hypothetical protein